MQDYIFAGILILVSIGLAAVMVILPGILGRVFGMYQPNAQKNSPYECGIDPVGSARVRFSIKFYLIAMLFILFDIEAIFLYPWAVVHRWLGVFGLIEMGIFMAILVVGYVYVWKRGALQWE
jgi:NADH-quinone oxidoreductase subunit A